MTDDDIELSNFTDRDCEVWRWVRRLIDPANRLGISFSQILPKRDS
jgi:hypothetical protein